MLFYLKQEQIIIADMTIYIMIIIFSQLDQLP